MNSYISFLFSIFSVSQFSQTFAVPPRTGPSQEHMCLVILLW